MLKAMQMAMSSVIDKKMIVVLYSKTDLNIYEVKDFASKIFEAKLRPMNANESPEKLVNLSRAYFL